MMILQIANSKINSKMGSQRDIGPLARERSRPSDTGPLARELGKPRDTGPLACELGKRGNCVTLGVGL